jgi:hypothetical protein
VSTDYATACPFPSGIKISVEIKNLSYLGVAMMSFKEVEQPENLLTNRSKLFILIGLGHSSYKSNFKRVLFLLFISQIFIFHKNPGEMSGLLPHNLMLLINTPGSSATYRHFYSFYKHVI